MKFIREGTVTPEFLASLDKTSNIIMCTHMTEYETIRESTNFPDVFHISLPRDVNLSSNDIISISTSALAKTHLPKIKMSVPIGIMPVFTEFVENHNQDIFWKIYKSFDNYSSYEEKTLNNHIIENIKFIMYIDTIRMREAGLQMILRKGTPIVNLYFTWYIQTKSDMIQVENIYLITDNEVYENFVNIF